MRPQTEPKRSATSNAGKPQSTLMTIEDVQRIGTFFKEVIEGTHLKKWIILAGVGGLCEGLRLAWDVLGFLKGHAP